MSITRTIYDWLGHRLSGDVADTLAVDAAKCAYMELARLIGASYVSAAIQACDIRFYDTTGKRVLDDAAWLWNVSPNDNYSSSQLLDAVVHRMFECGQALVVPFMAHSKSTLWYADEWTINTGHGIGTKDHFTNVVVEGQPMKSDFYAGQVYRFDLDATPDKRFTLLKKSIGEQ